MGGGQSIPLMCLCFDVVGGMTVVSYFHGEIFSIATIETIKFYQGSITIIIRTMAV